MTVKVRYADYVTVSRARTLEHPVLAEAGAVGTVHATVDALLAPLLDGRPVRLVGVRLSKFEDLGGQRGLSAFGLAWQDWSGLSRPEMGIARPELHQPGLAGGTGRLAGGTGRTRFAGAEAGLRWRSLSAFGG